MKLSFPKAKPTASTSSINSKDDDTNNNKNEDYPEVFFYKNNQLLPANNNDKQHKPPTPIQSEYEFEPKPYYNHRRSLSMARLDSGMSGKQQFSLCENYKLI
jgi:hypothetical protein